MGEETDRAQSQMDEIAVPTEKQMPFYLIQRQGNKTTKLLATSNQSKAIEGQHRWYTYDLDSPFFVTNIIVTHNNYTDYLTFNARIVSYNDQVVEFEAKPDENKVIFKVNSLAKSFAFLPPRSIFSNKSINLVEVFGFQETDVSEYFGYLTAINSVKQKSLASIEAKEVGYNAVIAKAAASAQELSANQANIAELKSQSDRLKSGIRRLESQRDDLTAQNSSQSAALKDAQIQLTDTNDNLRRTMSERSLLQDEVAELSTNLKELKSNIDLFPNELESFVKQGSKNNRTYFWLALAPITLIVVIFVLLISGAVDLTTKITDSQNINIQALVVSRFPFVIVAIAVITACYKLSRAFTLELMNVNRQRLNLTKISIIAKDVSNSIEFDSNMTEDEKYQKRLALKMDLLREHLKTYISTDFNPTMPSTITSTLGFMQNDAKSEKEEEA